MFHHFHSLQGPKESKKKTKPLELVLLLPGFESLWQHKFSLSGSNNPRLFKTKKWVCKPSSISGKIWFCSCQNPYPTMGSTPVLPKYLYFWQNLTGYWFQSRGGEPSPFFQHVLSNSWCMQFVNPISAVFFSSTFSKFKDTLGLQKVLNGTWRSTNILLWHFFLKGEAAVHMA